MTFPSDGTNEQLTCVCSQTLNVPCCVWQSFYPGLLWGELEMYVRYLCLQHHHEKCSHKEGGQQKQSISVQTSVREGCRHRPCSKGRVHHHHPQRHRSTDLPESSSCRSRSDSLDSELQSLPNPLRVCWSFGHAFVLFALCISFV